MEIFMKKLLESPNLLNIWKLCQIILLNIGYNNWFFLDRSTLLYLPAKTFVELISKKKVIFIPVTFSFIENFNFVQKIIHQSQRWFKFRRANSIEKNKTNKKKWKESWSTTAASKMRNGAQDPTYAIAKIEWHGFIWGLSLLSSVGWGWRCLKLVI